MAVIVKTSRPKTLLNKMREQCNKSDERLSWYFDSDGDLTLNGATQTMWLRPKVTDSGLTFNTIAAVGESISVYGYALYHARLIELLLRRYDQLFDSVNATALPTSGDIVGSSDSD